MLAALLVLLQAGHEAATETAEHAATAAEHEAEPWLVEQVNHVFSPVVLSVERAIMPSIYGLFGGHWHEPAQGEMVIPEHIVWTVLLFIICIVGVFLMRGRLSVDRPSKGQQLLEVVVEQIRGLLDQSSFPMDAAISR